MRLTEELILLMLDEQSGYFGMAPDWDFSCVMAGAIIADLTLENRVDADLQSLQLIDATPTGDPLLDPTLEEISREEGTFSAQHWIEKNTVRSEDIVTMTLERLAEKGVLEFHSGGFWSLSSAVSRSKSYPAAAGSSQKEARTRILGIVLQDVIPDPRDVILICLMHVCNGFKMLLSEEDYLEKRDRIETLASMDLVGLSISAAVKHSVLNPKTRRAIQPKPIPKLGMLEMLRMPGFWEGNVSMVMCRIYEKYGPVVEAPFKRDGRPVVLLIGLETNQWIHTKGRFYLRTKDYIKDFENALGASRTLPGMDGAEHFRLRKSLRKAYSRATLASRLEEVLDLCRDSVGRWQQGSVHGATQMCKRHVSGQVCRLGFDIDGSDYIDEVLEYQHRILNVYVTRIMPRFMLHTPRMRRAKKLFTKMMADIEAAHAPAKREGKVPDLADTLRAIHQEDPQFLPDTDLTFPLVAMSLGITYLAGALAFALHAMVTRPELHERVRGEAANLFGNGRTPSAEDLSPENIDIASRLYLETQRMYSAIPGQFRTVMNRCTIGEYEIASPTRVLICQTATHYMDDVFKDPTKFDIDRYLPDRKEHLTPCAYGSYGLGTHTCLAHNWVHMQMVLNILFIAHHVELEVRPSDYKLGINPFPTLSPNRKMKFRVAEVRGL